VSEEVAAAMATGALGSSNAHLALSTTGIAGPTGAVPGKPVGTVCFGWSKGTTTYTERLVFQGDRRAVREQTVAHALTGLLRFLE
jgi:nicotinamide-nucleotide amidase